MVITALRQRITGWKAEPILCVCVCARVRACMCVCVCARVCVRVQASLCHLCMYNNAMWCQLSTLKSIMDNPQTIQGQRTLSEYPYIHVCVSQSNSDSIYMYVHVHVHILSTDSTQCVCVCAQYYIYILCVDPFPLAHECMNTRSEELHSNHLALKITRPVYSNATMHNYTNAVCNIINSHHI